MTYLKQKTKILCTIGPASGDVKTLTELIKAGMNVARLNFSHGNYTQHKNYMDNIRKASRMTGQHIGILVDLQGPKIRIGELKADSYLLKAGDELRITTKKVLGTNNLVSTTYEHIVQDVKHGDRILVDDGNLRLLVVDKKEDEIVCKVLNNSILKPRKGINIPGVPLSTPSITEKDVDDLEFAIENNADFLAVSFVRSADDIRQVRSLLKGASIKVIAKIERPEALENIDEIIEEADGLMVARGDLGIEIPLEEVPFWQKKIIALANKNNKFVITATQMLESMITHPTPTRAEITDVANSILDGTDAIMLSAETSTGNFPVMTVETMARIAKTAEKHVEPVAYKEIDEKAFLKRPDKSIAVSASAIAGTLDVKSIVAFTKSGYTALLISKQKPQVPIVCFTCDEKVARLTSIYRGVVAFPTKEIDSMNQLLEFVSPALKNRGLANSGDKVILTLGLPMGTSGTTNLVHVMEVE
jgi:pyruvate kinase